jgi:hypothetical protein
MSVQTTKPVTPYKAKKGEEYMNPKQLDHFRSILTNIKGLVKILIILCIPCRMKQRYLPIRMTAPARNPI